MNKITIVGLGAGDINQLPLGVYKLLMQKDKRTYLRTKDHPLVPELEAEGASFTFLDDIYEKHDQFEEVYKEIVAILLTEVKKEEIIYAVPGHPLVAEKTVQLLIEKSENGVVDLAFGGGQSFLDSIFQSLKVDPIDGFQLLDGTALSIDDIQFRNHLIIGQVYDSFSASEVKLTLMERLPYDYLVKIITAAGSTDEWIKEVPLHELDREVNLNNLTSVYVPPVKDEELLNKEFSRLRQIIATLRGPDGCPWDKKQNHLSLRKYLIEECFELIEAINEEDIDHIIEELGDVLLQVMLHSQIGEDEGFFSVHDVIDGISAKMIRRHPHVFGDKDAESVDDVMEHWQKAKSLEHTEKPKSVLDGINEAAPNLLRAYELQKKAANVGFDWPEVEEAWGKVQEELEEFKEELKLKQSTDKMEKEFGDILFSLVNIARFYKIDPELAIHQTNQKFKRRFRYIEGKVSEIGKSIHELDLESLDKLWNEAKEKEI
ncbi:bifunctional methyltransferase/pyrophosphohydrolase YabN [Niallia nealsonii]|uniref:Nucleoside triphosphate pyrophosphohydrolase n=1 Tax=Niallia nealsonii TaxID=115979 RepID=A0A2N0YZ05_9BACI|nr:nucleoside triphosphate pyrophosphohydrolase [Niallia nealsonii]PKG22481.1 nucleoside triphosphate pyrophosphohydrolase [Niallia nealsonii]